MSLLSALGPGINTGHQATAEMTPEKHFFLTYLLFNFKRVCVIICDNIVHDIYNTLAT